MDPRVEPLEHIAFRSWPAAEVVDVDGWRLRHTSSVTRRANSVWTNEWRGARVDESIDRVEALYRERSARPTFQLGPLSRPGYLDEVLARRGYLIDAPVRILVADTSVVRSRAAGRAALASASVHEPMTDAWFDISGKRGRFATHQEIYRALLGRMADRSGYALATVGGEPVAVGLGVCEPPWVGIFSMSTLAPFRRRGAASAVLLALAGWGARRGAAQVYLQVEADNTAARTLYERAGFEDVYGYHYRVGT